MTFQIATEQETDGRWMAEVEVLPGVMAYGMTRTDAVAKVQALALRVFATSSISWPFRWLVCLRAGGGPRIPLAGCLGCHGKRGRQHRLVGAARGRGRVHRASAAGRCGVGGVAARIGCIAVFLRMPLLSAAGQYPATDQPVTHP